jgi:uncharacterized protein (DUF58 family)
MSMNITWLIFLAIVFVGAQGYFFRRYGSRKLGYERYFNVTRCYEGDQVEMVERIANRKLIPVPWVRLESSLSANLKFSRQQGHTISEGQMFQNHRSLFSLMPYTQVIRRHKFTCMRRGVYELDSATLTVGDLFGIFSHYKKLTLHAQLVVYPRPIVPDQAELPSHSWQGDYTVKRWIVHDPFMFAGVREYQYGDPMKDINWQATARSNRMQVNQHDFTADRKLMVFLNVEDHEKMWNQVSDEALIERGIQYAAGIIQEAIHAGMEAGFTSNGYLKEGAKEPLRIQAAGGRGHFEYILEHMARMVIARSVPFYTLLEQELAAARSNLDIVMITSYMNDQLIVLKEQLVRNGNSVSVLLLESSEARGQSDALGHSASASETEAVV